jgi:hypothetical protein
MRTAFLYAQREGYQALVELVVVAKHQSVPAFTHVDLYYGVITYSSITNIKN